MDDDALPQHHRSGAHRARRHPLLALLLTLGAIGLLSAVLLWALLSLDVLGVGDDLLEAGGVGSAQSTAPTSSTAPTPTAAPTPSDPAATAATAGSSDPSAPESEATVDRSLPVAVLNSTTTPGLASAAAVVLQDAGWSTGDVGNFEGDEIPTTVLYVDGAQAATAQAVADDLGVGTTTVSTDVTELTVVLGPDYAG